MILCVQILLITSNGAGKRIKTQFLCFLVLLPNREASSPNIAYMNHGGHPLFFKILFYVLYKIYLCSLLLFSGYGKLLWYLQLKIFWNTFRNDCFVNDIPTSILPNKLIEKSEGKIVLNEHSKKVWPVTNFPDVAVITATEGLNDEHRIQHENK